MSNASLSTQIPKLTGKNWDRWSLQMEAIFGFHDVLEIVKNGVPVLGENPTPEERAELKENQKKDWKAVYLIHTGCDESNFDRIRGIKSAKTAWDTLDNFYNGAAHVKKEKLQSLRKQYENLNMQEGEKIADFFAKLKKITNAMSLNGETLTGQIICEKALRYLTKKFDFCVNSIEDTIEPSNYKVEEIQSKLGAKELRLNLRDGDDDVNLALFAAKTKGKKGNKGSSQSSKNYGPKGKNKGKSDKGESYGKKENNSSNTTKKDKSKIQCYRCDKYGHYASECWFRKEGKNKDSEEEANMAKEDSDSESDPIAFSMMVDDHESEARNTTSNLIRDLDIFNEVFVVTTSDGESITDTSYLDSCCSNHMTGHKEWLVDFNPNKRTNIRCASNRYIAAEGMGNILCNRQNGQVAVINNVSLVEKRDLTSVKKDISHQS